MGKNTKYLKIYKLGQTIDAYHKFNQLVSFIDSYQFYRSGFFWISVSFIDFYSSLVIIVDHII